MTQTGCVEAGTINQEKQNPAPQLRGEKMDNEIKKSIIAASFFSLVIICITLVVIFG